MPVQFLQTGLSRNHLGKSKWERCQMRILHSENKSINPSDPYCQNASSRRWTRNFWGLLHKSTKSWILEKLESDKICIQITPETSEIHVRCGKCIIPSKTAMFGEWSTLQDLQIRPGPVPVQFFRTGPANKLSWEIKMEGMSDEFFLQRREKYHS